MAIGVMWCRRKNLVFLPSQTSCRSPFRKGSSAMLDDRMTLCTASPRTTHKTAIGDGLSADACARPSRPIAAGVALLHFRKGQRAMGWRDSRLHHYCEALLPCQSDSNGRGQVRAPGPSFDQIDDDAQTPSLSQHLRSSELSLPYRSLVCARHLPPAVFFPPYLPTRRIYLCFTLPQEPNASDPCRTPCAVPTLGPALRVIRTSRVFVLVPC